MDTPTEPNGRLTAFGNQLIEVHIWLREELAGFRETVDSYLDGRGARPPKRQAHCVTFCSALRRHHTGEDDDGFPVLAERFPELRPVLEELTRDHHVVADILGSLDEVIGGLGAEVDPAEAQRMRAELDGLAAVLESHFVYEEKRLVSALNSMDSLSRDGSRPDFLRVDS
jgi:hemerythrin-like domain-containing protein